jgi:hypothetical protein
LRKETEPHDGSEECHLWNLVSLCFLSSVVYLFWLSAVGGPQVGSRTILTGESKRCRARKRIPVEHIKVRTVFLSNQETAPRRPNEIGIVRERNDTEDERMLGFAERLGGIVGDTAIIQR